MKTILTSGWGLNTRLVLGETHKPTPRDYEVLVEVGAASVNPKDWKLNCHLSHAFRYPSLTTAIW